MALRNFIRMYQLDALISETEKIKDSVEKEVAFQNIHIDIFKEEELVEVDGPIKRADSKYRQKMNIQNTNNSIFKYVKISHVTNKKKLLESQKDDGIYDYLGRCKECKSETFEQDPRKAIISCKNCGLMASNRGGENTNIQTIWSDTSIIRGKSFSYKRSNHMLSWILNIQGKENLNLKEGQFEKIIKEFKKLNLDHQNPNIVTIDRLRLILKKTKMPGLYAHVHAIRYDMTGFAPPQLNEEQEHEIMMMFDDVTTLFKRIQKKGLIKRSNMLSYTIVLQKILETFGLDEFLESLRSLKHRERILEQEKIWKLICQESELDDNMPTFVFSSAPTY